MHGPSCGAWDLNSSLPVEIQTDLILSDPKNPTARLSSQNPKILPTISSEEDVNYPLNSFQRLFRPDFRSGNLLWRMMIVIRFLCGRASAPSEYDTFSKRHRVVQSLTKLNNKI